MRGFFRGMLFLQSNYYSLICLLIGLCDRSKAEMQLLFENSSRTSKILEVEPASGWDCCRH